VRLLMWEDSSDEAVCAFLSAGAERSASLDAHPFCG